MKTGKERKAKRKKRHDCGALLDGMLLQSHKMAYESLSNSSMFFKPNKHKRKKLRRGEATRKPISKKSLDGWGKSIPYQTYEGKSCHNFGDECSPPSSKETL